MHCSGFKYIYMNTIIARGNNVFFLFTSREHMHALHHTYSYYTFTRQHARHANAAA